jgi:hypothetical protein
LIAIKNQLFSRADSFPDPAQGLRGHTKIGGDMFEGEMVQYLGLSLQQALIFLLRR